MTYNKRELELDLMNKYYEVLRKNDPLLGQIQTVSVIHGGGMLYESKETNKQHKSEMQKISTSLNLKNEVIREYKIDEFSIFMYEFINGQLQESSKMIFNETSSISEFTGNVMDKRGGKLDYEYYLEVLEKMDIRFDKNGNPVMPTVFCRKELFDKFSKIKPTEEQKTRLDKIIQTKKEVWYANKHYRKLSHIN
ncbi:MAG: hypothetical protein HQ541_23070 [Mariniphaga sp.]|nr:hypothetical protein [Mariniphaga sp.]